MAHNSQPRVIGCIPSRYASTRLPGKPLCDIGGKAMILHVVEKAREAQRLDDVVVLTDDQRILDTVIGAGHHAVMTAPECASGTDRIADYIQHCPDGDVFVNIQGDEILLEPDHIDDLVDDFLKRPAAQMGTLAQWVSERDVLTSASTAKIVTTTSGDALYFSRHCIPVTQNGDLPDRALIHIGVYIYTRETLQQLTGFEQSPLEKCEKLEQLRALENGITVAVTIVDHFHSLSVDTPEDLQKARSLFD
jgi:3-deoxy-manno-octulosonate cytidylyltransferase (CMP-KDO synthetase)